MVRRVFLLLSVAVFSLISGGCGEDAASIQRNASEDSVLKLISESGTDVRAGLISSQMSETVRGISDDGEKTAFLRGCADAIRRRFSKMTRDGIQ